MIPPLGDKNDTPPEITSAGKVKWMGREWSVLSQGHRIVDPEMVSRSLAFLQIKSVHEAMKDRIKGPDAGEKLSPMSVIFKPDGSFEIHGGIKSSAQREEKAKAEAEAKAKAGGAEQAEDEAKAKVDEEAQKKEQEEKKTVAFEGEEKTFFEEEYKAFSEAIKTASETASELYATLCKPESSYDKKDVLKALDSILSEAPFLVEQGAPEHLKHKKTELQLLMNPENRAVLEGLHRLRSMIADSVSAEKPLLKRFTSLFTDSSVQAEKAIRENILKRLAVPLRKIGGLEQHFQPSSSLSHLSSIMSEGPKKPFFAVRSGPATTREQLNTLLTFSLQQTAQLPEGNRKGLYQVEDEWHFRPHITSLFDPSVTGKKSKGLDEEEKLRELLQTSDAITGSTHVSIHGEDREVHIDRPLISMELFSASSEKAMAIKGRMNQLAALRMLQMDSTQEKFGVESDEERVARKELEAKIVPLTSPPLDDQQNFDPSKLSLEQWAFGEGDAEKIQQLSEFSTYVDALKDRLKNSISDPSYPTQNSEKDLTVRAMLVQLTGQDEHDRPVDALDQEIYRNILLDKLDLSSSTQCRDGVEKTGIAIALQEAQERFRRAQKPPSGQEVAVVEEGADFVGTQKRDFDPLVATPAEKEAFKKFFTDVLSEETSNPIVKKYLLESELSKKGVSAKIRQMHRRARTLWTKTMPKQERDAVVTSVQDEIQKILFPNDRLKKNPFALSSDSLVLSRIDPAFVLIPTQKDAIEKRLVEINENMKKYGGLRESLFDNKEFRGDFFKKVFLAQVLATYGNAQAAAQPLHVPQPLPVADPIPNPAVPENPQHP